MEADIIHSLREGNRCADYLSQMGIHQGEQDMVVVAPLNDIIDFLKQDMMGVAVPHGV